MKSIKGLIYKDLLNLSHYKVTLIIVIIFMFIFAISQEAFLNYIPVMLTAMSGMIALSTFSYDEISKSDKFVLALPTNRKEIVKEKYIFVIGLTLLGALISIFVDYIISVCIIKQNPDFFTIIVSTLGAIFGIGLVESIQIPSVYKWGAEKGRIQMFIMVILVMALAGGLIYLVTQNVGIDINGVFSILSKFGIVILCFVIIGIYYISYKISLSIYNKKEF